MIMKNDTGYFIGLMSGTSVDSIDAVVMNFEKEKIELIASLSYPIPKNLQSTINNLYLQPELSLQTLGNLNTELGYLFADASNELLKQSQLSTSQIIAIGSHGQTVYHSPNTEHPFSLQLGDPNIIAAKTGITTVANFRNKDIALGGQGAPLAPLFHNEIFRSEHINRCVVNIGGIANITNLPADLCTPIAGFDTGPGNTLMDRFAQKHLNTSFDRNGDWAKSGQLIDSLLEKLLEENYFKLPYPKSTGREYFNLKWLQHFITDSDKPSDVQRTICELTAMTIAEHCKNQDEMIVCGGGVHNTFLMARLSELCAPTAIVSSAQYGVDPDLVEAITFAWLAKKTINKEAVNLKDITGGATSCILGGIYL